MYARRYVASLVTGGLMTQFGDMYMKRNQPLASGPQQDPHQPPEPAKHDVFAKATQKLEKRRQTVALSDPVTQFVKGADPRMWQIPGAPQIQRAKEVAQYVHRTSGHDRLDDTFSAAKEKGKQSAKKILSAPMEAIEDTRKAASVVSGITTTGPKEIETRLQSHLGLETANAVRQFGMNMMMKAPTYLIPGPIGVAARTFMTLKTVGNLGRNVNELHKATGKEDGLIMQTVHKRLEQGAAKPTKE